MSVVKYFKKYFLKEFLAIVTKQERNVLLR